jgi:hypothetical protein
MADYYEALQKQQELKKVWCSDGGMRALEYFYKHLEEDGQQMAKITHQMYSHSLKYGECFYWSRTIVDMISVAARTMPHHWSFLPNILPAPNGFFWFSKTVDTPLTDEQKNHIKEVDPRIDPDAHGPLQMHALTWTYISVDAEGRYALLSPPYKLSPISCDDRVAVVTFDFHKDEPESPPVPVWPLIISVGATLEQMINKLGDNTYSINDMTLFAAMLAFLQQKIVIPVRQAAPRSFRRQAAREQRELPPLNVIKLRHHIYKKTDGEPHEVDWAWQWLVKGHWRDQWYPSIQRHQPIWISPYMKGPEDKPFKDSERIFAVIR